MFVKKVIYRETVTVDDEKKKTAVQKNTAAVQNGGKSAVVQRSTDSAGKARGGRGVKVLLILLAVVLLAVSAALYCRFAGIDVFGWFNRSGGETSSEASRAQSALFGAAQSTPLCAAAPFIL